MLHSSPPFPFFFIIFLYFVNNFPFQQSFLAFRSSYCYSIFLFLYSSPLFPILLIIFLYSTPYPALHTPTHVLSLSLSLQHSFSCVQLLLFLYPSTFLYSAPPVPYFIHSCTSPLLIMRSRTQILGVYNTVLSSKTVEKTFDFRQTVPLHISYDF